MIVRQPGEGAIPWVEGPSQGTPYSGPITPTRTNAAVILGPYANRRYARTPLPDLSKNFTAPGGILPADLAFIEEGQKQGLYKHITPERLARWKLAAQRNALTQFAPVTDNQSRSMQFAAASDAAARVERRAPGGRY